jgi:hypothetical protein
MPDLFLVPDDRFLLAKWDHLIAVFRIVARDYRRVLAGEVPPDRHRTILIQTVSDLLDVEADLFRLGKDSPSAGLGSGVAAAWVAAASWVGELRAWRFPHDSMPVHEIEKSLLGRKLAEERFVAAVCDLPDEAAPAADTPTVLAFSA